MRDYKYMAKKPKQATAVIAKNKSARFEFAINKELQAGLQLQGWEVKAIRQGRVNMSESYVFIRGGEAYISGLIITPLTEASTPLRGKSNTNP